MLDLLPRLRPWNMRRLESTMADFEETLDTTMQTMTVRGTH
jgi:hypothetical protein